LTGSAMPETTSGRQDQGCAEPEQKTRPVVSLRAATQVWAQIGLLSFGGPAGQIALMHRILVHEKRWISESRFLHALNFCMLLPGPEAQQLATYVGWMLHRVRGGLIAGTLFILPGFLVILALSYLYVAAGSLPLVQGLFLGLKSAIVVIVLHAMISIGRRSLTSPLLVALALAAFIAMYVLGIPFPVVILAAGLVGLVESYFRINSAEPGPEMRTDGSCQQEVRVAAAEAGRAGVRRVARLICVFGFLWLAPTLLLLFRLGPENVFSGIGAFFSKMAVVTFGGAYAVLAYVSQEAVQARGWLMPGEMIDALAMAETTPGPLILVVQFVGFIAAFRDPGTLSPWLAGLLGSLLTLWVTFVPCFMWIFLGAPYMEQLRQNRLLSEVLSAVTAAVVGVVANLAVWFAVNTLFADLSVRRFGRLGIELPALNSVRTPVLMIALGTALLLFRLKTSIFVILATASGLGMGSLLLGFLRPD